MSELGQTPASPSTPPKTSIINGKVNYKAQQEICARLAQKKKAPGEEPKETARSNKRENSSGSVGNKYKKNYKVSSRERNA